MVLTSANDVRIQRGEFHFSFRRTGVDGCSSLRDDRVLDVDRIEVFPLDQLTEECFRFPAGSAVAQGNCCTAKVPEQDK